MANNHYFPTTEEGIRMSFTGRLQLMDAQINHAMNAARDLREQLDETYPAFEEHWGDLLTATALAGAAARTICSEIRSLNKTRQMFETKDQPPK